MDATKPCKQQEKNQMPSHTPKRFATQTAYNMIESNGT